ncbi:cysteine--tRNA ligase [Candidatus Daviesbacteria bacterium]|nr:cysteine--tRNA ligase [Candidatus Daviesbacteria bacterium]
MLKLYNTLTKKIEEFTPLNPPKVGMYTCGQTVYDYTHVGHLRTYIGEDILRRVLVSNGYDVKHVQNVTDVGHLTSDADEGDDKLDKRAKERGQTVWEVARFFEKYHFDSLEQVNVLKPSVICRATEHINEQIKLIEQLFKKGYTYQSEQAIYFDTSKLADYGKLTGQKLEEKKVGVRDEVVVDPDKKHPADFALWFFTVGHFKDHTMRWSSPWGEGFPGWHIECSAMSMEYLGNTLDIHAGGIDHIPVHHTNEIAQSEAATGQQFSRYWVHFGWLLIDGEKMSKSKKNFYTIDEISDKGFDPLALRYLFMTAHYRDMQNFTWESLEAAQNALNKIREEIRAWESPKIGCAEFQQRFLEAANNDLNMPQAVAVLHELIRSDYPTSSKARSILEMDKILGLKLDEYLGKPLEIPEEVRKLVEQRKKARLDKDFKKSDELRKEIKALGFEVEDTPDGPKVKTLN